VVAIFLMLAVAGAPALLGAQLLVSQDGSGGFTTIQGAINAAAYGDVIRVAPGVYEEGVVFKNGVTLIGSGAAVTTIRYGYGFDPVLQASHASAGRIEGFTIERTGTVLSAPAVLLVSASITIADVTVTGAQQSGIEVADSTSNPTIERTVVSENGGHGVWLHGGAGARLVDCEIRRNGGNGLLVSDESQATLARTDVAENAVHGIALANASATSIDECEIRGNGDWGIELRDETNVSLNDCSLAQNGSGGLRLLDDAEATVTGSIFSTSPSGATAEDRSALRIEDSSIRDAIDVGLNVFDDAVGTFLRSEIVGSGSDGAVLSSSAPCSIDRGGIVRNAGSGLVIRGDDVSVSNTILAYNGGLGVEVDRPAADPGEIVLSHNNVWANGDGSYAGVARRASDISESPEFADLDGDDLTLRPDSPCIGRGVLGETIGAHPDPSAEPGTTFELSPTLRRVALGLDLSARVRFEASSFTLETAEIGVGYDAPFASLSVVSSVAGAWGTRTTAHLSLAPSGLTLPFGTLTGEIDGSGVLDGSASWASFSVSGSVSGSSYTFISSIWRTWPSSGWTQEADLTLGRTFQIGLSAETVDLSPRSLAIRLAFDVPIGEGAFAATGELGFGPDTIASVTVHWAGRLRAASATVSTYLDSPGSASASFALDEKASDFAVKLHARLDDYRFDDGSVSLEKGFPRARFTARLGLDGAGGSRAALVVAADLGALFAPSPNLLPSPAFVVSPDGVAAEEPVSFDATGSQDPDGEIVEYWWDFGDGGVDLGERVVHTYREPGGYDVTLTVADDGGGTVAVVRSVVIWEPDTAPVAAFSWEPISDGGTRLPRSPRSGDLLRLDASSSYDPTDRPLEYHWDLDSDGAFDVVAPEPIVLAPPVDAGTHPITLRVVNADGRTDAVMHAVVVAEPKPPRAAFSIAPASPSVLDPIRFTDQSSDADGEIVSWEWRFGDGHASRARQPTHQFSSPGDYVVTLTVVDDDGLAGSEERTVQVVRVPEVTPVDEVWVLAIGITDYESVLDLEFGRDDAVAVARWALNEGVPPDHVRLLTDQDATLPELGGLETHRATLVNVREGLGWLRRVARPDDLALISFSGHGYQGLDDGADERDGIDEFFVLFDTRDGAIDDTGLRDDEFGRFLDRLPSEHVLVFFDGCYSGGLARSLPSGHRPAPGAADLFSDFSLEGRLVFSASSESQDAFESQALGHGVFTYFVLEGLRGKADLNGDDHVTAWEIYEYVLAEVPSFVRDERGAEQIPQIVGEGDVRVVVSREPRSLSPAFSYAPTVPFAGGAVRFRDETGGEVASREWTFDDEARSTERDPTHTFVEDGAHRVSLRVVGPTGDVSETVSEVEVAPTGRIAGSSDGLWVISLGSRNGVALADRFEVHRNEVVTATIEVVELLDADASACRLLDGDAALVIGDVVFPATQLP